MSIHNVIAYLLTDGGIDANGRIYFSNTSNVLIDDFKNQVEESFGTQKFSFTKAGRTQIIRFSNNKVKKQVLKLSPSFRTRSCKTHPICPGLKGETKVCPCCDGTKCYEEFPPTRIPDEIMNSSNLVKKEFLTRIFSADGGPVLTKRNRRNYIEIRRMIILSSSHPTLKQQYKDLLLGFGIIPRDNGTQLQIERREDIEKFKNEINFLPGVVVTKGKRWLGLEKRKVLEFMSLPRPKV
jgi:intein/homing endonuclease